MVNIYFHSVGKPFTEQCNAVREVVKVQLIKMPPSYGAEGPNLSSCRRKRWVTVPPDSLPSTYSSFAFFLASPFSSAALPLAWPAAWFASPLSSCALPAASPRSSAAFPLTSPEVMLALASLTLSLAAAVAVISYRTPCVVPPNSVVMYLLTANLNAVDELV